MPVHSGPITIVEDAAWRRDPPERQQRIVTTLDVAAPAPLRAPAFRAPLIRAGPRLMALDRGQRSGARDRTTRPSQLPAMSDVTIASITSTA